MTYYESKLVSEQVMCIANQWMEWPQSRTQLLISTNAITIVLVVAIAVLVDLAGVYQPPHAENSWLRRLAEDRTRIRCELLQRRSWIDQDNTATQQHSAVCKLYFTPGGEVFQKDLAASMVRHGRAGVLSSSSSSSSSSSGLHIDLPNVRTVSVDTSDNVKDLQRDVKYMESLQKMEYQAIQETAGMWANDSVRSLNQELVEEVEYQTKTSIFRKVWNRVIRKR